MPRQMKIAVVTVEFAPFLIMKKSVMIVVNVNKIKRFHKKRPFRLGNSLIRVDMVGTRL